MNRDDGWSRYLGPGEVLLWSGQPDHGRRFREFSGIERTWQLVMLVGTILMWLTWPMIDEKQSPSATDAIWVYGAVTIVFALVAFYMATTRAYILSHLHYAVTNERAIVLRTGRNHLLAMRDYLISCWHAKDFPYGIVEGRPYSSLTVGFLLSEDVVQPFGYGLTHSGWSPLRVRGVIPVLFEQVKDANALRTLLFEASDSALARRP